jgi:hypothetical protein
MRRMPVRYLAPPDNRHSVPFCFYFIFANRGGQQAIFSS